MRLSRIWRILQIKEGVIHRGRRPRWITPSEICRILDILRKPNSIIALLFIQNISSFLKEFHHYALTFSAHPNITQPCPQVFSVNGSIICGGLHFWRHFDVIGSIWRRCFPNLVNSTWLWCIMRVALTNQKRENILNDSSIGTNHTNRRNGWVECIPTQPEADGNILSLSNKIPY